MTASFFEGLLHTTSFIAGQWTLSPDSHRNKCNIIKHSLTSTETIRLIRDKGEGEDMKSLSVRSDLQRLKRLSATARTTMWSNFCTSLIAVLRAVQSNVTKTNVPKATVEEWPKQRIIHLSMRAQLHLPPFDLTQTLQQNVT